MNTQANRVSKNDSSPPAKTTESQPDNAALQFEDNRPELRAQMQLQEIASNSPQGLKARAHAQRANQSARVKQLMAVQEMADEYTSQTLKPGKNTKPIQAMKASQPVIQRVIDPAKLKGVELIAYNKIPGVMKLKYKDEWKAFLAEAETVAQLAEMVTKFMAVKEEERIAAEAAKKAASAAKEQANIEAQRAAAEAVRKAAAERIAAEQARKEAAEALALAEQQAKDAEKARLAALFKSGVHKVLTVDDVESYSASDEYRVSHGREYGEAGDKDYGIYINISDGKGPSMTTHFHVHDGGAGGNWSSHFKQGMAKTASQGWEVSKSDATKLFTVLGFTP